MNITLGMIVIIIVIVFGAIIVSFGFSDFFAVISNLHEAATADLIVDIGELES